MAENMGVSDFVSRFTGGGARPNLYKVTFNYPDNIPGLANLDKIKASYLCKAASLPDQTLGVANVPFMGRTIKIAGDRTFNDWTVTMINDTDFQTRKFFEKWNGSINTHAGNIGISNPSTYYVDMMVQQLDRQGNAIYTYDFMGCFPSTVSEISLGYDQNDSVEEFTVTFAVNYWVSKDCSGVVTGEDIPKEAGCKTGG